MALLHYSRLLTSPLLVGGGIRGFVNTRSITVADNLELITRTQGTGDSRRKMTFSFWFRPSDVTVDTALVTYPTGGDSLYAFVSAAATPELIFSGANGFIITAGVTYANNTWYHVVVQIDTANATAADRGKIIVDGVDRTSIVTTIVQNYDTSWGLNTNVEAAIQQSAGSVLIDEVAKIDNALLGASSFASGGKPVDLKSLTFGAQGYWLRFETGVAATVGDDSSGNGLNFANSNYDDADFSTTVP